MTMPILVHDYDYMATWPYDHNYMTHDTVILDTW
jgi:hypothetical protein